MDLKGWDAQAGSYMDEVTTSTERNLVESQMRSYLETFLTLENAYRERTPPPKPANSTRGALSGSSSSKLHQKAVERRKKRKRGGKK